MDEYSTRWYRLINITIILCKAEICLVHYFDVVLSNTTSKRYPIVIKLTDSESALNLGLESVLSPSIGVRIDFMIP
jgi:hypothetical protein